MSRSSLTGQVLRRLQKQVGLQFFPILPETLAAESYNKWYECINKKILKTGTLRNELYNILDVPQ